ncbi:flagellar M-ring protein FliF [Herbaspirillum sp. WGmk3]|uniref:flagellar basal-body MS-ring/collar protein FliF n=1 Tax=Herbaspirillum sp. WGmk3 TaxID=2919925 RepID=UPI002090F605|nr:flagellar basal-body MS-ring/collar protein FliF [Herbaspirillum sp. WGmk3]MCO4855933.1 flagellar M-ring protein FliF [Herbaspirillum sp. WGmk3]
MWEKLGRGARIGLIIGVLVILGATVAAMWLVRTDYQVLFSDLSPQDAGAMVGELDKMKQPYKLADGGRTILIDKDVVHQTRIKLMSKELPLHGTIGFELFNNTDFGMTEFAQKINYQRALQGEITRTILSLSEIQSARVHLALPEEGLFKRAGSVPKASITLTMKQGEKLRPEQVSGIQRLVAAAVPGISQAEVTIIDQHGVALTRAMQGDGDGSSARLDLKKEMEAYLAKKVGVVLDRTFGVGQAMATVDVSLNMDQIRTTTEDVLAPPAKDGMQPAGTLVRERETVREGSAPLDAKGAAGGSSQRESEYSVGRRVENIVAAPGSVRRINVVAVVRKPLDTAQQERIKSVVAAAVGASLERGDTVIVQPLTALVSSEGLVAEGVVSPEVRAIADSAVTQESGLQGKQNDPSLGAASWYSNISGNSLLIVVLTLLILAITALAGVLFVRNRDASTLTDEQRRALLIQLQSWMQESEAPATQGRR